MLPTSPSLGNEGLWGAVTPQGQETPHPARSPLCLCQAPTNGPRRPASSHFCAQGPLSPARERNIPMSNTGTGGHVHSGGMRKDR